MLSRTFFPKRVERHDVCCHPDGSWAADWKLPHESWTCYCGYTHTPADAVPWPAHNEGHLWHSAPTEGSQDDYRAYWDALGVEVGPFGIP